MPKFMLVLYDDPSAFADMSPADIQGVIEAYNAWAGGLAARGKLAGGDKLKDEPGKVLRGPAGKVEVRDGPYSETKEVLGGYFMVEAADYDEAVALSRDCPHLRFGGTIEIRELDPMEPK